MLDCSPTPTPQSSRLQQVGQPLDDTEAASYIRSIGHLIYLTNTRPDISFSVNNLSLFVAVPTTLHRQAAYRVLHYLNRAPGNGLFFHNNTPL